MPVGLYMYFLVHTHHSTKLWEKISGTFNSHVVGTIGGQKLPFRNRSSETVLLFVLWIRYIDLTQWPKSKWVSRSYWQFKGRQKENSKNTLWDGSFYIWSTCDGCLTASHGLMNRYHAGWMYSKYFEDNSVLILPSMGKNAKKCNFSITWRLRGPGGVWLSILAYFQSYWIIWVSFNKTIPKPYIFWNLGSIERHCQCSSRSDSLNCTGNVFQWNQGFRKCMVLVLFYW